MAISNFAFRALNGEPLISYGDGEQTRDFIYTEEIFETYLEDVLTPEQDGRVTVPRTKCVESRRTESLGALTSATQNRDEAEKRLQELEVPAE